jgi:hypothetical protein
MRNDRRLAGEMLSSVSQLRMNSIHALLFSRPSINSCAFSLFIA